MNVPTMPHFVIVRRFLWGAGVNILIGARAHFPLKARKGGGKDRSVNVPALLGDAVELKRLAEERVEGLARAVVGP